MNAVELGELSDAIMGQAPPGRDCNKNGEGTVFVKAGEFGERYPTVREWTTTPLKMARRGDVLVCVVGATAGKVNQSIDCAIGRSVAAIRPRNGRLDGDYLFHFLASQTLRLRDKSQGLAQGVITREMLNGICIPLPAIHEQRRIAAILDKADAVRRKRAQSLALADDLLKSAFLEMFGSKTWPSKPLSEVVAEGTIVTYGIVQAGPEHPGGVPYIRTGDIKDGKIVTHGLRRTTPEIASKFARSTVRAGEIVMSIRATVGTTAVVPEELDGANLTQGTARISPGREVTLEYLLHYLRSSACQNWIEKQVKGATFREITLTRLRELEVPLPPPKLQRAFANIYRKASVCQRALALDSRASNEMFASLSQRAFRGEL